MRSFIGQSPGLPASALQGHSKKKKKKNHHPRARKQALTRHRIHLALDFLACRIMKNKSLWFLRHSLWYFVTVAPICYIEVHSESRKAPFFEPVRVTCETVPLSMLIFRV